MGRIIELYEGRAVIQILKEPENMSLVNTHTKLSGHPDGSGSVTGYAGKNI